MLMASALVGLTLGYITEAMLVGALAIVAWQIYRLDLIYKWVTKPRNNPLPETSGQVHLLHLELSRRQRSDKQRKRQLTQYVSQIRKAISVLPDAIVLIDIHGNIQWANQNADRLLGINWPQDHDVRFTNLIRDPKLAKHLKLTDQAKKDGIPEGIEIPSTKNGDQILNIKAIPYTDDLRMIIIRDVSRLLKINRMHADFVANVSHELKTPLTVLRGYLEILENQKSLDEKLAKPLQQMSAQSERMQLIVNDLLYLSRLEDTENQASHQTVDVTHLVNTIIETVQSKIAEHHHKVQLDIDYNLKILGSPNELHSAFSNLIFNAINYTPDQGVITIKWEKPESGEAIFSVSDNGIGISAAQIPRLTERFYRVDDDRSREGGGTGLGLAIAKHVMQRHDGHLEIESTVDVGSTFRCVFQKSVVFNEQTSRSENLI